MTVRVTAPLLLPNTPDCDFQNGEELLTPEKIAHIKESYKSYNLVDYEHQFLDDRKEYYLTEIGKPVNLFITDKEVTYKAINGEMITTPPETLYGTIDITNPVMEQKVLNKQLTACSVSVAEKTEADNAIKEYKKLIATKSNDKPFKDLFEKISSKRKMISEFDDPALFTISLTSMPCVHKAMFCENIMQIEDKGMEVETMAEKTEQKNKNMDEDTFMDKLGNLLSARKNNNKEEKEVENKKEDAQMNTEEINDIVNEKINEATKSMKDEITTSFKSAIDDLNKSQSELIASLKAETEEGVEETEEVDESEEEVEETEETEAEKVEPTANKSRTGTGIKHINKSAQISQKNDGIGTGKSKPRAKMSEREVLMRMIKGTQTSNKSFDDVEIDYSKLNIVPEALKSAPAWTLIHPALKESFTYNFTEESTQKLILPTNQYALYMRELLSTDPLMQDANFRIDYEVSEEERYMYSLRLDADPTQDGIMEEHYYFDNPNINAANIEVSKDKLNPMPVRAKLHISDRQIKQNVMGEDLLANALNLVKYRYDEGVSRINYFGDTELADTEDIKFRRRDGLFKQCGTKLVSDDVSNGAGAFNLDDGIDKVFKKMFRALPFEAQKAEYYNLYVPPYVYDAYREYYLNNDKINFIGNITDEIPLKYKRITIKEAPILADNKGIQLNDDNVSMLLTSPQNTHFLASRALRLEPERLASTSSTKYWYTGDFDMRFALPEYAVSATISKEEYQAL